MQAQTRKYLVVHFVLVAAGLLLQAGINLAVDPSDLFGLIYVKRVNAKKILKMDGGGRTAKSYELLRKPYETVILGTSRAQVGLDPRHPAFAGHKAYNLAFEDNNMFEIHRVFDFAAEHLKLSTVVLTLDFHSFSGKLQTSGDFEDSHFSGANQLIMRSKYLLSYNTLKWSRSTVLRNIRGQENLFVEGYRASGLSTKNQRKYIAHVLKKQFLINDNTYAGYSYSKDRMELFHRIVSRCREDSIELKMFISPVHALQLETLHMLGLYPMFEKWKTDLTAVLDEEAKSHPHEKPFLLWDFTGYSSITTESIPPAGDATIKMKNFWETSHYKKELGDMVLNRVFGREDPARTVPPDFGVAIDSANINAHLTATRKARREYLVKHSEEIAFIADLVKQTENVREKIIEEAQAATAKSSLPVDNRLIK